MRSPHLVKTRDHYALRFYDATRSPKRKTVGLGTTSKHEAEQKKALLTTLYLAERFDPWRESPETALARLRTPADPESDVTLAQAAERFLEAKRQTVKPRTLASLEEVIGPFVASYGGAALNAVTPRTVEAFCYAPSYATQAERSARTKKRRLTTIKALYRWAVNQRLMSADDANDILRLTPPRVYESPPRWLTHDEFAKLVEYAYAEFPEWLGQAIELACYTGIRQGSLIDLEWRDLRFETNQTTGHIAVPASGAKTNGYVVPVFRPAALVLERINENYRYAPKRKSGRVLVQANGKPLSADTLSKYTKTCLVAIGCGDARFHDLRHTFATWLVQKGVPIEQVSKWLGHADLTTTMRYAHHRPNDFSALAEKAFDE